MEIEHKYCSYCGYPITVQLEMNTDGRYETSFRDDRTGAYVDDCPGCGDWLSYESLGTACKP